MESITALPPAIHYINLRNSLKQQQWKEITDNVRTKAHWKCQNCGKDFSNDHSKLHSHEMWSLDFNNEIAEITDIKALCGDCHSFYHQGLYGIKRMKGEISDEQDKIIKEHWNKYPQQGHDYIISNENDEYISKIFNSKNWTVIPFDNIIRKITPEQTPRQRK